MTCEWCSATLDPLSAFHVIRPAGATVSFDGILCLRLWATRTPMTPREMERRFPGYRAANKMYRETHHVG